MRKGIKLIAVLLIAALSFSGCMRTVDQMYRPPKRSEKFTELQKAIDSAMTGLSYCAPVEGENQQSVQMADLNGDGIDEYILFAKADAEHPLRVLIFRETEESFDLVQTIESIGTAFNTVEYVNMDDSPGLELVFGSQLSDQLIRNVCVYSFAEEFEAKLLVSTHYTKFLCEDLDGDQTGDLFVLRPGSSETDNGIVELYRVNDGKVERTNEITMSGPAEKLKRIQLGKIHGGVPAVYVAITVDDSALLTDVFICENNKLVNAAIETDGSSGVKTLRNYYIYADDIDADGILELPYVLPMMPMENMTVASRQELIRWYAITPDGEEIVKTYTFHDFIGGWYIELACDWAPRLTVVENADAYEFYIWDQDYASAEKIMTVSIYSSQEQIEDRISATEFVLFENESVLFAAKLEDSAETYNLTPDSIIDRFHLIGQAWNTGEI